VREFEAFLARAMPWAVAAILVIVVLNVFFGVGQ
jgi:hypothetical protein